MLSDATSRQSIRQATSLTDLVVLASGDAVVPLFIKELIARLCVALTLSKGSSVSRRRRMKFAIAESVNLRTQLKPIQVKTATQQSASFMTNAVIKSLKQSTYTQDRSRSRVRLARGST